MWLTARELCNELHITPGTVTTLRRRRQLAYINLGTAKLPNFRYQIPPHSPIQAVPAVERVAFLTHDEVASLLGVQRDAIRKMMTRKQLRATRLGKRSFVTVQELRRVLAIRDRRSGQAKQSYSPILMRWLKSYLESREIPVQVLDSLVRTAAERAPLDQRSGYITKLWSLFDEVNRLLREIEKATPVP